MVSKRTIDLSGFGGGYEDMCQRMLWRGVAYLAEAQPPLDMWQGATSYPGVVGVLTTEGEALQALEAAIMKPGDDVTGAMHQAVMEHLAWIHKHGVDAWLEHSPQRIYQWTGDLDPVDAS